MFRYFRRNAAVSYDGLCGAFAPLPLRDKGEFFDHNANKAATQSMCMRMHVRHNRRMRSHTAVSVSIIDMPQNAVRHEMVFYGRSNKPKRRKL